MHTRTFRNTLRDFALAALGFAAAAVASPAFAQNGPAAEDRSRGGNAETVRRAFDAWAAGTGGPYDLLRDDARWTIVGRSAAAGTYRDREAFMRDVIRPFNARMREPLKPKIRRVYVDGDTVIVLFDARGVARDGVPYENTYTWYLTMQDGRIVESVAFFDSIAFNELWSRVSPSADAAR